MRTNKLNHIILMKKRILLIFWLKILVKSYSVISIHFLAWKYSKPICQDRWWWTLFYFLLSFSFYFTLLYFFLFLFLEQLGLGFISHAVTSVTNWWCSHKTDHRTQENGVEGSGIKWYHTTWTTYVGLMSYTWSFRVGCTVVSTDHE